MRKLFLCFFLFSIAGFSQKKEGKAFVDSILVDLPKMKNDTLKINQLNEIANIYQSYDTEKGLIFAQKALSLSKKLNYIDGQALAYKNYGVNKLKQSKYEDALLYYEKGLQLVQSKKTKSRIISGIGLIHYLQGNYTKALEYGNESLLLSEEVKDINGQCSQHDNIGIIYRQLEKHPEAIKHLEKAIEIAKTNKLFSLLPGILANLGNSYADNNQQIKAIRTLNEAKKMAGKIGNIYTQSVVANSLSQLYTDISNYDLAIKNANEGLALNKKLQNELGAATSLSLIGYAYLEKTKKEGLNLENKKNLLLAIEKYKVAIEIEKKIEDTNSLASDFQDLSKAYELLGNFPKALSSYQLAVVYRDSIFNSDNKETIKNLEDKREIELRDKEIKINKLSLEANQKQKWFYILGLGFMASIGGLLFYQSYKRKLVNLKLETLNKDLDQANKTKTRFFSILNHDLRSPVSNLIHFLHLQQNNPELLDEETKNRMQTKTITGAENLLSSMEDILLWSKGQMENFKPQPKKITVNQLFDDTKKVFSGYLKIKFEYHNPDNLEIFTDENYLKTIIRNLTSNAINVFTTTENPTIIWKAWQENGKSYLSITDNGSGASQENFKALYDDTEVVGIKTGLGLHLIRDLAKAIACEIEVDSKIGVGTTFVLKLNS